MRQFKSKFARRGGRLTRSTKTFAGSDWRELLNQRAREINAFRRASVPLPNFEVGARVPWLYPGEPDSGITTLEAELAAPDGWRDRVDEKRRAELSEFIRGQCELFSEKPRAPLFAPVVSALRRLTRRMRLNSGNRQ